MFDYHIHPNYSIDAEGSLEEFCEEALRKGLKEIAFTTHLDTDPVGDDCFVNVKGKHVSTRSSVWLEDYETSIRSADDKYRDRGLRVRLGVEIDYISEIESALPENFHSTDFDIILGSMHLVDHIAISATGRAEAAFKNYSKEELGSKYYTLLIEAVESGLFDIVAHIDLYRRFGLEFYGEGIKDIWKPHIGILADAMKKNNVGFEVNTSPLRRGQQQPMPEAAIINELKEQGVSIVTVGSDAHQPQDVGSDFGTAYCLLRKAGFSHISLFSKRKVRKQKIPQ
ncbi:histidinol-phosphatase HisJ family protein [Candidatus Thorarchaeota archaeon]|nr:histidinol-phosphatase [Candidatus Thorarchaeota archaeon]TFG99939.1 MAG: histidinol-phosphatase HisJ family protein [Candidatus Thorarchaeota archaeon]